VSSANEAHQALKEKHVQGVLLKLPLQSEQLKEALSSYSVPFGRGVGPFRFTPSRHIHLRAAFFDAFTQVRFSERDPFLREALIDEVLHTMNIFSRITGPNVGVECKLRFQRPEMLKQRAHYDTPALNLVRTLKGSGTWLLPKDGRKLQMQPFEVSIYKGTEYPDFDRQPARLLHDYPSNDDEGIGERGRIIVIASCHRGVSETTAAAAV
jgi:hypothetical protein